MQVDVDKKDEGLDWLKIMLMKPMILTEAACVLTFICPPLGVHHSPVCVYTYNKYKMAKEKSYRQLKGIHLMHKQ